MSTRWTLACSAIRRLIPGIGLGVALLTGCTEQTEIPVDPPEGSGPFLSITAGDQYMCGIEEDGGLQCWGSGLGMYYDDLLEQLTGTIVAVGTGTYQVCGANQAGELHCVAETGNEPADPGFVELSIGGFGCGRDADGAVTCWCINAPACEQPPAETVFSSVDIGTGSFGCGVDEAGGIRCWGEFSEASEMEASTATYHEVALGREHACGLGEDGVLECWSDGGEYEVRDGTYTAVDSFGERTCAAEDGGGVECWNGSNSCSTPIDLDVDARDVAVGNCHVCTLDDGGGVTCSGEWSPLDDHDQW